MRCYQLSLHANLEKKTQISNFPYTFGVGICFPVLLYFPTWNMREGHMVKKENRSLNKEKGFIWINTDYCV